MSTSFPTTPSAEVADDGHGGVPAGRDVPPRGGRMHGRSGLVVPLLLAAFSTYLLIGILMVAGYLLAALLVLHYLRSPEHPEELSESTYRTHSDWSAVIWSVAGFLVFALTIEFLGWILAAAVLFWAVAHGIGAAGPCSTSRSPWSCPVRSTWHSPSAWA